MVKIKNQKSKQNDVAAGEIIRIHERVFRPRIPKKFQEHLCFSLGSLRTIALYKQQQLRQNSGGHRLRLQPLGGGAEREQRSGGVLRRSIGDLQDHFHQ